MPRPWLIGIPLVALLLGLFVGMVVGPRREMKERLRAREQAHKDLLRELGGCLRLERWVLRPAHDGGVVLQADVTPGRDGRLALDGHADQGNEEVLVPEVQTERLLPATVRTGERVRLERALRRVRPGEPDAFTLRFSCRPPGPRGVFGVIEYATSVQREGADEFGSVVRPLPPQGH